MMSVVRDLPLTFSSDALAVICRRYSVSRLSAFGSVLREDFRAGSDVDLLVEFEPGRTPGFGFFSLQGELARLFGRRVDLNTRASLSPYFRNRVLCEARELYRLIRGYGFVDLDILWEIVATDLPLLVPQVERVLESESSR